ncbi:MAG: Tm-1-like ATP-binding domain-containing protein, partial [Mixta calida]|nr:Tm-1-like ATP-binding domain-containing protein [Mixta calida]
MKTKEETGYIYVAATADTKGIELYYVCDLIRKTGLQVRSVDLSAQSLSRVSEADVTPEEVAAFHPQGIDAVFCNDRGSAIAAMSLAFQNFLKSRQDVAGILGLGGSGGTAMVTPAMQALPVGVPKVMVSTM